MYRKIVALAVFALIVSCATAYAKPFSSWEDVNGVDSHDRTLLHLAVSEGNVDIVRFLIHKGAYVNVLNDDDRTPLHLAVMKGRIDIVRLLIAKGAYESPVDKDKRTPLHMAIKRGDIAIVRLLIVKGADLMAPDKQGRVPYCLARGKAMRKLLIKKRKKKRH